ncbi:MAG: response regulator [Chlorobium sp.]|jgi:DNA-binding response OmpR family regulator|uniref:response regulator n=1 Tax=Chlorobium sp. TaxID=1095 RepID=UPI001DFD3EB9|nr:response regulator [Chlorobium sp.]MBN1278495.1 response regulator [Chlorobiaceae bacterium]MCF8215515.1 response regulator [Chlorobium sp.]MCF8270431.1 response regulator [Chlorobium sp.]MCF8286801.1 response regulator [Chlorobium sp.]MCF8290323.1 response regulator [Chlorobium sp.]
MRILVIEDDEAVRKFVCKLLVSDGYNVICACNGKEGIAAMHNSENISHVITDLIMPEKEGIETIGEIRKNWPMVKIIAMSGGGKVGPENYLLIADAIGAHATLKKPFGRQELLSVIKSL